MSKRISLTRTPIEMPSCCAVCLEPAHGTHSISRTLIDGRQKATIELDVPLCASDLKTAEWKSPAQITAERSGIAVGIMLSLGIGYILAANGESALGSWRWLLAPLLTIGGCVGTFPLVWRFFTPLFLHPKTRHVRNAVVIERFVGGSVDLIIDNEMFAGRVLSANERR